MPLVTSRVFEARNAAQYNGANSGDLASEISDFTVVSETPTSLTFTSGGQQHTVARNGYIAWYQGEVTDVFQNQDDYRDAYASLDTDLPLNHVHDLTTGPGRMASA